MWKSWGDFEGWKRRKGYGKRWVVEGVFSLKRVFGEYVSSRKFVNMIKELVLKFSLYNMFINLLR